MVCLRLFCDSMVKLDALLHDVLVAKGDYVETLRWDELVSRYLAKMTPVHCITFAGAKTQVHRGRLEPIELDVVQRGSNKKVQYDTIQRLHSKTERTFQFSLAHKN